MSVFDKTLGVIQCSLKKVFYVVMNLLGDLKVDHGTADFRLLDGMVYKMLEEI